MRGLLKNQNQTKLITELSNEFDKTAESIRDRIKRYIKKLSPSDQDKLIKAAKKNPGYFVHFHPMGQVYRKIKSISPSEPSAIFNQTPKKSGSKKTQEKEAVNKNKYQWLI